MLEETCKEWVSNGGRSVSFHICGRPMKEGSLCGIHARAKRVASENKVARVAKNNESNLAFSTIQKFLDMNGINANAEYSALSYKYTGRVVITLDELQRLMSGM